ncbi:MAG: SpoIIE family protein phosphatase [Candidatus Omnitrophica bacterium]|nr:SpoIIE family protein phosphatase [Candidatus Omnitrophota bacterium]
MEKIIFPAKLENLDSMLSFVIDKAKSIGFKDKQLNQIRLAAEEALVNIVNYAYPDKNGDIEITFASNEDNDFVLEIADYGIAFDPLSKPQPDLNAPLEKRNIGGLGIYLLRKIMDEVRYRRENNRNILTFVKKRKPEERVDEDRKDTNLEAAHEEGAYSWPISYMKKEEFKKGEFLFKAGDKADRMFYIKKGALKLIEINKLIREGEVIGEMGIFSPFKQRTASARCEEDVEAYTMGRDEVINFFSHDPNLAINLIQLSIKRFIENLKAETQARERIESELRIAHEIQNSMLPRVFPPFPDRKEFDIFAMMDPAKEVGGDFYDFFFVDKNRLCVVIGDVSGKGVPAALFMAISKTLFRTEAMRGLPPDEVVSRVNNLLCLDNQTCMFVTVFCLILNTETGEVQFCNGGHNPPLICNQTGCFQFIEVPKGFVIGAIENSKCVSKSLLLKPNDIIFLYTDGVTEAMNPQNKLFSEERLKSCLEKYKHKDITEIVKSIREEISDFAQDAPQSDDITMLVLRYNGRKI